MTPFLLLGNAGDFISRSRGAIWDLGHLVLFLVLTIGVLGVLGRSMRTSNGVLCWSVAIAAAAAICVEWLQGFVGRNQSLEDVALSVAGTVLALLLRPWWDSGTTPRVSRGRRLVLASLLMAACLLPTTAFLWDEWQARSEFPSLADFRSRLELTRLRIRGKHHWTPKGPGLTNGGLVLMAPPGASASWQLTQFPSDWRGYGSLQMRLRLDGDATTITCILNDQAHEIAVPHEDSDHYAERIALTPGWQVIAIDLERAATSLARRRMNMQQIASFRCATEADVSMRTLILDYLRLRP